jgi:hypothetical protein
VSSLKKHSGSSEIMHQSACCRFHNAILFDRGGNCRPHRSRPHLLLHGILDTLHSVGRFLFKASSGPIDDLSVDGANFNSGHDHASVDKQRICARASCYQLEGAMPHALCMRMHAAAIVCWCASARTSRWHPSDLVRRQGVRGSRRCRAEQFWALLHQLQPTAPRVNR